MIHLHNLNPIDCQESINVDASCGNFDSNFIQVAGNNDQLRQQQEDGEITIYGDDDEVEDPENYDQT